VVQPESVLELIEKASAALAELLQLLQQEQDCLVSNRIDDLATLISAKQQSAGKTEQATGAVEEWFNANGIASREADIRQWLAAHLPQGAGAWETLREQARQASAINKSNGQLIDTRRQLVDGFVAELAHERGESTQLYSGSGQLTGRTGPFTRGKA